MRLTILVALALILSGCAVKDQSFYDLKSPCVSAGGNDYLNPCIRTSPVLNDLIFHS